MTDFSKVLGVIASTLQIDVTELTDSLKDGDNWLADDEITKKLGETISSRVRAAKEEQRKRALRESSESLAKWAKGKGFEPDGDLKGTALLDAYNEFVTSKQPTGTDIDPAQAGKLTREELAKLPEVQKLITDANTSVLDKYKKEVGAELDKVKTEYTTYKAQTEREKVESVTLQYVTKALTEGNVLLEPANTKVSKDARIKAVLRELDLNRIKINDKGQPFFVDEHGEPLSDPDFGKPVDFSKHVVTIGKDLYGERGPDPGKTGGNPQGNGSSNGNGKYQQEYFYKSPKELSDAMFSEPDAAKRAKMSEDFTFQQEQQKKAAG